MTQAPGDIRKRTFGKVMQNFKAPFVRCYAPGDACKQDPIRAHSVQNASTLELLQENGHVYTPKMRLAFQGPELEFGLIGRNLATTFHGLCNEHDTEIFRPIEANPLDLTDDEHLFLLSYRAVLKETHATAKSAVDTQAGYKAGVDEGLFPDSPCAPGMLAVEHAMLAYTTHMHKLRYDRVQHSKNFSDLSHFIFDLEVGPTIAACSLLSTGRFCQETDSLAYATLNVIPIAATTQMVVSCLKPHEPALRRTFLKFFRSGDTRECVSYLVLKRCENFVLRPSAFISLTDEQKNECQPVGWASAHRFHIKTADGWRWWAEAHPTFLMGFFLRLAVLFVVAAFVIISP